MTSRARRCCCGYLAVPAVTEGCVQDAQSPCRAEPQKDEFGDLKFRNLRETSTKLFIPSSGARGIDEIAGMRYRSALSTLQNSQSGGAESFFLTFSSPASGHQLVDLQYSINYLAEKQPRIDDWLVQIKNKFGGTPLPMSTIYYSGAVLVYSGDWLKDISTLQNGGVNAHCAVPPSAAANSLEEKLKYVSGAKCRLVVLVSLRPGASPHHVGSAFVEIWDPYRYASNLSTDLKALHQSREKIEKQLDMAAPKL